MDAVARIVLTGGPGGGKSTLIHELRASRQLPTRYLFVPEAAPLLLQAGVDRGEKALQRAVVRIQVALEEAYTDVARSGLSLLCHRGTLDPLAYWLWNGWDEEEFFTFTGMSREEHLCRYLGVVHLQTAAIGAEESYLRWPSAHRAETPAEAAELDHLCARAWRRHPRYTIIKNLGQSWDEKARSALAVIRRWLAHSAMEF